ncbi:hypothetical protein H0H81_000736 [Sphagnurus paluster]|uniref:Uncharacterized protein n=1 Tax=Sphagnurus paluster TaxID=117069 RepID=A0A9P7FUD8_9AGAR|nr:hypothetical protein H0H81_000736 [Sphagnurus paluster]
MKRLRQIPALLQTIESSQGKFDVLIKNITMHAYIPESYGASFVRYIQRIVDMCPRVSKFAFASQCQLPPTARLPILKPSITHLQLHAAIPPAEIIDLLKIAGENLMWLLIYVPSSYQTWDVSKVCHLPNLTDLLIETTPLGNNHLTPFAQILSMPSLRRLTFKVDHFAQPGFELLDMENFTSFCRIHGHYLQFLHLQPNFSWTMRRYTASLQRLLDTCPIVDHLVLHPCAEPVAHSNVKWIDIWSPHPAAAESWDLLRQSLNKTAFPKLQRVRELSSGLALFFDVPTLIDAIDRQEDAFELAFHGIKVRHDVGFVQGQRHIDVDSIYGPGGEADDDNSSDFSFSSDESRDSEHSSRTNSVYSLRDLCHGTSDVDNYSSWESD